MKHKMKQQSDPKKTKYYTAYNERMNRQDRCMKAIKKASGNCWWIEMYLKGIYFTRKSINSIDQITTKNRNMDIYKINIGDQNK